MESQFGNPDVIVVGAGNAAACELKVSLRQTVPLGII